MDKEDFLTWFDYVFMSTGCDSFVLFFYYGLPFSLLFW